MRYNYSKRFAGSVLAAVMAVTLVQPMFGEELNIEEPSAGAALAIENYIASTGSETIWHHTSGKGFISRNKQNYYEDYKEENIKLKRIIYVI